MYGYIKDNKYINYININYKSQINQIIYKMILIKLILIKIQNN
jgi:hypothetical protein